MSTKTKRSFNIWRMALILLAVVFLSTYLVSYLAAKFLSNSDSDDGARVANFSCYAVIDDVSALSFTNTAFWGGTVEEDRIAMNALRSLHFTVNNWEVKDNVKTVAEVAMEYDLQFTAPQNFTEKLAIQLFDSNEAPMLPQIVLSDLIGAAGGTYNTADSTDYTSTATTDVSFDVSKTESELADKEGNALYTYTATTDNGYTIKLEPVTQKMDQTLYFRLWDCSKLTGVINPSLSIESGDLLAPMQVVYTSDVLCYKISVSHPDFRFAAGVESSADYSLTLAPTSALADDHLGGYLVDDNGDYIKSIAAGDTLRMETITETITDVNNDNPNDTTTAVRTLLGGVKVYSPNDEPETEKTQTSELKIWTSEPTTETTEGTYQIYEYYTREGDRYSGFTYTKTENATQYYRLLTYTTATTTTSKTDIQATLDTIITTTTETDAVNENVISQSIKKVVDKSYNNSSGTTTTETTVSYSLESTRYYGGLSEDASGVDASLEAFEERSEPVETKFVPSTEDLENAGFDEAGTSTTTFTRTITRTSSFTTIDGAIVTKVTRNVVNTDTNKSEPVYYTSTNRFEFYADETGNDLNGNQITASVQQYFLSQCYSKNYPMTVNVLFEQISG